MTSPLQALFEKTGSPIEDGLVQSQREAIVDLLHYCMFADDFIASRETEMVGDVAASLIWDANISFDVYSGPSIARARRANEEPEYRERYLRSIVLRLGGHSVRKLAYDLCRRLFAADLQPSERESARLERVRQLLGL